MSRTIALLAPWLVAGCAVNEGSVGSIDQGLISPNGITINGVSKNLNPNLISPNGVSLNGVDPTGLGSNGASINISGTGAPLTGAGIVGSAWTGRLSDGQTLAIRIDGAMQGTGTNSDVWSYRFSALLSGGWQPLCVDATGKAIFGDTVSGSWNLGEGVPGGGAYHADTALFTIACRGSAAAKCLEFGYKPWTGHGAEMASCVRALRADFCGDGKPFTVDGTMLNIFDDDGIQSDSVDWVPEAEWSPDGATCVSKKKDTRFRQVAHEKPACAPHTLKQEKSCGTGFTGEAKVITELPPR